MIGFLNQIPLGTGRVVFEEYTYTALLPYSVDTIVLFFEKKALSKQNRVLRDGRTGNTPGNNRRNAAGSGR
ncbi:MAG: hypothetical protein ACTSP4_09165 [Candidatus Hodarchaeales archaeon]